MAPCLLVGSGDTAFKVHRTWVLQVSGRRSWGFAGVQSRRTEQLRI